MLSDLLNDAFGGVGIEVMGVKDNGGDEWDFEWLFDESKQKYVSIGFEIRERRVEVLVLRK